MNRRRFLSGLAGSGLAAHALPKTLPAQIGMETSRPAPDETVDQVLVMFKCHLDVGFVDTQAAIIHKYFTEYYPRAISIAQKLRDTRDDREARYIWTTGSWLLYRYLEQANATDRKRMEDSISRGDVAWHALPFTWQSELLDPTAMTGCLGFSKTLDRRFGRTTTGAKMTDVPGHTRGLIAPLSNGGVQFLDIGVNSASTPPEVPPVFVWKDARQSSLIVMYHRTNYGGVVRVPGSRLVVAVEVRDDNSGPHTIEEIQSIYAELARTYPKAAIRAADLTTIGHAVKRYEPALPVLTQEIGDTWIYGVASDPVKIARFRELLRLRREWIHSGTFAVGDSTDLALLANASLAAEHTWGTDTKTWLDFDHYTPAALQQVISQPNYRTVTNSWAEKRADIDAGIAALPAALRTQAEQRMTALKPLRPNSSMMQVHESGQPLTGSHYTVALDARTGAICKLVENKTKHDWASAQNLLASFSYQTLSEADYKRFLASYITVQTDWAPKDFGKPNIQRFGAASRTWQTRLVATYRREDPDSHDLVARLRVEEPSNAETTAFPEELWLDISLPKSTPEVRLSFSWFSKRANRMPEGLWLSFHPLEPERADWTLTKSGQEVSPFDVVRGGNRHMHAVSHVICRNRDTRLSIEPLDSPVVALGERSPIYFSNNQPDLLRGIHFSLFNNGWGTNYIQWFSEDVRFRFVIRT